MGKWRLAVVLAGLALGACSTNTCRVEPPPEPVPARPPHHVAKPRGAYKVGAPYVVDGVLYTPRVDYAYDDVGIASWYGQPFHHRLTANGERFDQNELTAAHQTLPLPSVVRVTNLENGRSLVLRVNDRGPFVGSRILDVSKRAAKLLRFHNKGVTRVRVQILEKESRQAAESLGGPG